MASTITQSTIARIGNSVPAIGEALVATQAAAIADIEALQAANSSRDWKESVRFATTAALAANTRTSNVLLADANGALGVIDGVTPVVGDRCLVKNEGTGANNGLYTVTTLGSGGSKWSMTRATDADSSAEVTSGLVVEIEEGTVNAGRVYELTTANPITLNTTALTFSAFAPGLVQTTDTRLAPTPTAAAKILYDTGAAYAETNAGTAGQIPVINAGATAPVFVSVSGDATLAATGALTVAAATAAAAGKVSLVQQMGLLRSVRGVVITNQANLAAFTVASDDGITYVEGDRVLLANQTTATQDGIYTVGAVGGGTAALTLASDYANASVQPAGLTVNVNEGTVFGGTQWFASLAGAITVGTSSPEFYPRKYVRITTAMAGTPGVKALSAEWILSATRSSATPTVITPGGTNGTLSIGSLTPGDGDGSFTVTSTANETSTLQIVIQN